MVLVVVEPLVGNSVFVQRVAIHMPKEWVSCMLLEYSKLVGLESSLHEGHKFSAALLHHDWSGCWSWAASEVDRFMFDCWSCIGATV